MFKFSKNTLLALYSTLFAITMVIAMLLYFQYRYFMQETQELLQVKESYYQHVDMLNRSLNASLHQQSLEDADVEIEKKKSFESIKQPIITQIETQPDFEIISQEEEERLKQIKKNRLKEFQGFKQLKKKSAAAKVIKKLKVQSTKYKPKRDFVFYWPIDISKFWLSSLFGPRKLSNGKISFHYAIDMAGAKGTPVKASASGKVILATYISGYGNCVMIVHNDHYKTRYAHLDSIAVQKGQFVSAGELIGTVGDTGSVRKIGKDASHLHFEIYQDGIRVNPLKFLFS